MNDSKSRKFGIIALATAVISWGCVLGIIPSTTIIWFSLLAVSVIFSVLSLKTRLGKSALVLLILEVPTYIVLHTVIVESSS